MEAIFYPDRDSFVQDACSKLQLGPNTGNGHIFTKNPPDSEPLAHLFPVYCEKIVDSLTPTSIFLKLRDYFRKNTDNKTAPLSYLLESVNVNEQTSRFSYIGAVASEQNDSLGSSSLLKFKLSKEQDSNIDPLRQLENLISAYKYHEHPDLKGIFTGGAVGYVGFECVKHFEPRTMLHQFKWEGAPHKVDVLEDLPDAMFIISDIVIIFDHLHNLMRVIGNVCVKRSMTVEEIATSYDDISSTLRNLALYLLDERVPSIEKSELEGFGSVPTAINDEWEQSLNKEEYISCVQRLKEHIRDGDIVQCVPARRIEIKTELHPFEIYRQLRSINPSPYLFYIDFMDFQLVGASPEMLIKVQDRMIFTHPIAGTRRRGETEEEDDLISLELMNDEKERAEHIMLVDLGRNDVNRVCKPETTKVDSFMHIERFSHVMHIVSQVSGTLREDKTSFDAFRSIFPAGTVSGAPKVRALELIFDNEPVKRGPYGGAVGYFAFNQIIDTCIGLRMMVFKKKTIFLQAGGGVVHDSDPLSEFVETENKLRANMVTILRSEVQRFGRSHLSGSMNLPSSSLNRIKTIKPRVSRKRDSVCFCRRDITNSHSSLMKIDPQPNVSSSPRVLLIDNYDSFTWNVYQYFCHLGAKVQVFRNDALTIERCEELNPDYLVISPGPGSPKESGISCDAIRTFAGHIPILGVCLGEQCIFEVFGGIVTYAGEIVHGKTSIIEHDGKGVFTGVSPILSAIRYHSLAGDPSTLPQELIVSATTQNGVIMGVRHCKYVIEGVQFHPESIGTEEGLKMIANFLSMKGGLWVDSDSPGLIISENASILERIVARRKCDIAYQRKGVSMQALVDKHIMNKSLSPTLNLHERLMSQKGINLIAEIKRASPSKGDFDTNTSVIQFAAQYFRSGAVAISVLTEPHWFKGSLEDIVSIRATLEDSDRRPAILMKDFIIDEYQILMGRISGADTCLLILAILDDVKLVQLLNFARSIQMEPLVEIHTLDELRRALSAGAKLIGVNNRNLHTFVVDLDATMELFAQMPPQVVPMALSGISTPWDVELYRQLTCKAVLVGESLMLAQDRLKFASELLRRPVPLVKICGLTTVKDLLLAQQQGSNFLGLIFTPKSRFFLDLDTSKRLLSEAGFRNHDRSMLQRGRRSTHPAIHYHKHARELQITLRQAKRPLIVGVFSDQSIDDVLHICHHLPLDLIQLHGSEDREFAKKMPLPVIRSFSLPLANDPFSSPTFQSDILRDIRNLIHEWSDACEFILVDKPKDSTAISTGRNLCDWKIAKALCDGSRDEDEIHIGLPLILAGGLNVSNLAAAIDFVNPFAVDVCSGIEKIIPKSILPHKDPEALIDFINILREDRTLRSSNSGV